MSGKIIRAIYSTLSGLGALLPPRLTNPGLLPSVAHEISIGLTGVDRPSEFDILIDPSELKDALSEALTAMPGKRYDKVFSIHLSPAFFLCIPHTFPARTRGNIEDALGVYIRQNTPFSEREIAWKYQIQSRAKKTIVVTQYIIKKEILDTFERGFSALGIDVIEILLSGSDLVFLDHHRKVLRAHHRWNRLAGLSFIGALAFLALGTYNAYQTRTETLAAMRLHTSAQQDQAISLRDALSNQENANTQLITLADQLNAERKALEILATLTEVFPDNVWLAQISIRSSDVRLAGFSAVAPSALIAPITNTPMFAEAILSGPVIRDQRLQQDRFEMALELENPDDT